MLKLSVPTRLGPGRYIGQVAYGTAGLPADGTEAVAQNWVAVVSEDRDIALTCINDGSYGSDFADGELRLSLLRSPAYSADPAAVGPLIPQDRYVARMTRESASSGSGSTAAAVGRGWPRSTARPWSRTRSRSSWPSSPPVRASALCRSSG